MMRTKVHFYFFDDLTFAVKARFKRSESKISVERTEEVSLNKRNFFESL